MIQHLSRQHAVVVASLASSEEELHAAAPLKDYAEDVLSDVLPVHVRWRQACRALPSRTPSSVAYFSSSRLYRRVQHALRTTRFDAVIVHCAFAAHYVDGFRGGLRLLDFGDLDSSKWSAYSRYCPVPLSWGYALEARKLRRYERELAQRFHQCTVTTQGELDAFQSLRVRVPCVVIPNGVDTSYFCPGPYEPENSCTLVFLGRMDYFPNIDGITQFVRHIFPLVRARIPKVELRIIGANPTREVRDLASLPGVTVSGSVPDVRPLLKDAAISIAPLRIARGTQNKILESMAMGLPVVATPVAAKGIQAVPGRHLLVAEEPAEFAQHIVSLIESAALRKRLSELGRREVACAHDWAISMRRLEELLDRVSGKHVSDHDD